MKIKKLMALAVAMLCTAGAWAQTDVTSTYLTNADFSQGTPVTVGVCTYAKDKAGNGTDYANLVAVDGWTAIESADGKAGGLFAIGGGAWLGGKGFTAPATDSDGNTGVNVLGVVTCWGASVQYTQDLKQALPAGTYTLVLAAYNSGAGQNDVTANLIGFIEEGGTTHYATTKKYNSNTWKYEFIEFTLTAETSGKISIGYTGAGSSNNLPHLFVSGLTLFEGSVDATEYEAIKTAEREAKEAKVLWDNAVAAANAALTDEAYNNVIGAERAALQAEVAKAEPSTKDDYNAATTLLGQATLAFEGAKTTYDLVANVPTLAYADASKKPVATSESTAATLLPTLRAYYESHALAEGVAEAVNMTDRITNANNPTNNDGWTWTGNKNNPASNEPWTDADGTNTHSYFDGGNWGANSWTTTMEQTVNIPAGKYLLTAKGRAATNVTFKMAVGEVSVDLPHVSSVGNVFDRGWGDASLEFESDGSAVTIKVTASSSTLHEWFSISDFRLVRLELYTEMAKAEDYAALNAAIEAAEAKTLGFDANEYAPYNNVEALKALATAKAIDQTAENGKDEITALTTALGKWTANAAEVDAIFDGQFATTEALSESGKVVLPGWTKIDGIRLLVKDETTDPGLAYTDGKAAVFSWGGTTLTYGAQAGYTLPLNKHELYELTLKVSGWRDGDLPNVVTIGLDGATQTVNAESLGAKAINVAEGNPFASLKFYVTPTEDNSTLTVYGNHHFTVADLSLKLAVAEEVELNEAADYTPAETYANVTLKRSIKNGYNTVVLPFDLTAEQTADVFGTGAEVYTYSETAEGENSTITFAKKDEASIAANVPVLVKATAEATQKTINGVMTSAAGVQNATGTNFDFVGSYSASTALVAGDYFFNNAKLYKSNGDNTMKGFRAYLKAKTTGSVKLIIEGLETGIEAINGQAEATDGAIYNVAGQRVQKTVKGLYIINGKKVMVK